MHEINNIFGRGCGYPGLHEKLIDYVCGELDPGELAEVEEHVDACPCCQAELAFLRTITDAVCTERRPVMTETFWQSFVVEVHQKIVCCRQRVFPLWSVPVALAGLGLLLGLAYVLSRGEEKNMADAPGTVLDSALIYQIRAMPQYELESIITHLVEIPELDESQWDFRAIEPRRLRQLVSEELLLERKRIQE